MSTPPYNPTPQPSPMYLPNLIVAMVASAGIVIGSLGPWLTFFGMVERTNTDGDGKYTLVAGVVAAAALFAVFNLGRSQPAKTDSMIKLSGLAMLAGVGCFLLGIVDASQVTSRKVELFGQTLGPQIGWGLWMVLIMSLMLIATAVVVARQSSKLADDDELAAYWRDNPEEWVDESEEETVEETVEETTRVRCVGCAHVQSVPVSQLSFECEQCGKQLQRKAASS